MAELKTSPEVPAARPGRVVRAARFGLAVALLAYVVTRVEWATIAAYRHTLSWPWVALLVGLVPLGHLISSVKWSSLLRARGHEVGVGRLTGLYVVGQFYNVVLPSFIGGDVVRSLGLRRIIGDGRVAFASTVAERATGAVVLVALGVAALTVALPDLLALSDGAIDGRLAAFLAMGSIGGVTIAIVAIVSEPAMGLLRLMVPSLGPLPRWLDKLERFHEALLEYRKQPRVLAKALGYSLLFNAVPIGIIYAGCRATGDPATAVGILDAVVMMPLVMLIALLPLTPGGYGVLQWSYMVAFAAWQGAENADAETLGLFVSLLHAAANICVAATGYAIYAAFTAGEGGAQSNPGEELAVDASLRDG